MTQAVERLVVDCRPLSGFADLPARPAPGTVASVLVLRMEIGFPAPR